ncbi:MAG: hypothetical protein IM638_07740 [Bacteroidetes bacterium]|nr:hypothetical protein [Bacteroidota bacterium]
MNTYNDNLHNSIVSSLSTQEVNKKTIHGQAIASMFTLFHAQGATIDASDKLKHARLDLDLKKRINDYTVSASNISTNMLSSATQATSSMKQSISNTAVAAANVQVATDAIVRLSRDMGGVYSIVNAADFDSDIYKLTADAHHHIGETAYHAETMSDHSMQSSIDTAEVVTQAILDKAKNSNTSLSNFLSTSTGDFNAASQNVLQDTLDVAAASVIEQQAEGNFSDVDIEYKGAVKAYYSVNQKLNLDLGVTWLGGNNEPTDLNPDTSRKISFNPIRNPFWWDIYTHNSTVTHEVKDPDVSPVKNYYIMLAKDQAKFTFSLVNAENILTNGSKSQYVLLPSSFADNANLPLASNSSASSASSSSSGSSSPSSSAISYTVVQNPYGAIEVDIDFFQAGGSPMIDTDGDPVAMGTNYVVFIVAVYKEAYKKRINVFEDYLSAFSPTFALTNQLQAADITTYNIAPSNSSSSSSSSNSSTSSSSRTRASRRRELEAAAPDKPLTDTSATQPYSFTFTVSEFQQYSVDYRLMFLPVNGFVKSGMMDQTDIRNLEQQIAESMKIAAQYDPMIDRLEDQLAVPGISAQDAANLQAEITKLNKQRDAALRNLIGTNLLTSGRYGAFPKTAFDVGYVFNLTIAEQVSAGNYLSVLSTPLAPDSSSSSSSSDSSSSSAVVPASMSTFSYSLGFGEGTTDIFGNLLEKGQSYMPVILSMNNDSGSEENANVFNSAWTGKMDTRTFTITNEGITINPVPVEPGAEAAQ